MDRRLPEASAADDDAALSILNPDPVKLPGPDLLHQLVRPPSQALALEYLSNGQTTEYTYEDLHNAAEAIAVCLTEAHGRRETEFIVPVLVPQSPLLYAALLGVLKAGGSFCPLNIDAPPERVNFILQDVAASVVLVSEDLADKVPAECSQKTIIASFEPRFLASSSDSHHRSASPDDLAYVMYTSGSTGTPKGVGISHGAATQSLLSHDRHIPPFDRFLQFASPTFDVSVFEIFFPIFRGSTLITARRAEMLNDLPSVMREMRVDACELTPTVAGSLLKSRNSVPTLKLLLTIGEMLTGRVVDEFGGDESKASTLWAMYGPTEATIHCTLQPAMLSSSAVGNIGFPLDTVSCFVVEPISEEQPGSGVNIRPRGSVGELAVGGYQLAREYLNRPDQNAAAFVSSPYGRLYRTGDKARILADGTIECLGRLSTGQVKLRGQRIELGEVEQAIVRTEGCLGAVAAVENSVLVAFCTVESGVSEDSIMQTCKNWLPLFMLPGELVLLDSFPKLPSGKVDRRKLLDDFRQRKEELSKGETETEQLDEFQRRVLEVISETLGTEVHAQTPLGSAGLDSLTAIRLSSSLRGEGFDMSASILLSSKTVSDVCSTLEQQLPLDTSGYTPQDVSQLSEWPSILASFPSLEGIKEAIEDVLPCVPIQSAMLAETARQGSMYWNQIELDIDAGVTAEEFVGAFHQLAQRNEILRSGFLPWREGFVALIFKDLDDSQVRVVDELQHSGQPAVSVEPLRAIDVQIQTKTSAESLRALVQIHHAIYDGWSYDMLLSDLGTILRGLEPAIRPQFREYVSFYRHCPLHDALNRARSFWTDQLAGWRKPSFPVLIEEKSQYDLPACITDSFDLSRERVVSAAGEIGCSSQVFFQSALALIWSGIVGTQDVVIGTVTSGRTVPIRGIERLVGPCIAALPLRIDLSRMTEVVHLLNHIQTVNRGMMEHHVLSLADIKSLAGVQAGSSLYDVLFVYQESPEGLLKERNIVKETRHVDRLETKLLVEIEPHDEGFGLQITYHPNNFTSEVIHWVKEQIKATVDHILKQPRAPLNSLRKAFLDGASVYNEPPTPFEGIPDLAHAFEEVAKKYPDAGAICFAGGTWAGPDATETITYEQLNSLGNKIARFLRSSDVKENQVVCIVMEKSIQFYAAVLAIIKAGCAYLPLLPSTPLKRVMEILEQAEIHHCVVDTMSSQALRSVEGINLLDIDKASLGGIPGGNLNMPADGSRLAYIIYTSGTTGKPKGVAVNQRNIMANISYLASLYPQSPQGQSRLLQACSQAFDVSVFEIFFTWYAGMCLCAGTTETLFENIERAVRDLRITHLSLTPTVASLIDPSKVPDVMFLVTAGEPMTQSVLDMWKDQLWQGYGPSETTNICSVKQMRHNLYIEHLGWTFPNTSVYVLYPDGVETVPFGWVGEFCFGGDQVVDGYFKLPQMTEKSFINHPKYGRLYRSGDMGRMLPDGSLVILGRLDGQLKLRGQRIEAGEVNSTITTTGMATAAVTILGRRQGPGSEQLVSFYVPADGQPSHMPQEVELRTNRFIFSALQSRMPSYMVPSCLIPIPRIPQTKSGKVDRRQLESWFESFDQDYIETTVESIGDAQDHGDWTSTEESVAAVIAHEGNIEPSSIRQWTPFATIGVDSVSAIRISQRLSEKMEQKIPVSAILQNTNVAQLASYIDGQSGAINSPGRSKWLPENLIAETTKEFEAELRVVETILPCTPLQEAMLSSGQRSYVNKVMLRLLIDPQEMRGYWTEISNRHGILRTCFTATTDVAHAIIQVVLSDWEIPWKEYDVVTPSFDDVVNDQTTQLPEAVDSKAPPVSLALIRYKGSVFLSFICHHALYDGVAMENLWAEIEALANGHSLPAAVPYEPFLKEALRLPTDTERFWKDQLHEFRPTNVFPRSTGKKVDQAANTSSLNMPLNELYRHIQSMSISLLSLCQCAWANTLSIAYDTADVCFGNVVSGRTIAVEGIERLIAPCFNTIPIRKDVSAASHGAEMAKYFHQLSARMLPYQFTPLRKAQRLAGQGRGLFETLLLLQKPLRGMDDRVWILEGDASDMDVPLVCEVVPCPGLNALVINMQYDMNAVDSDVAATLSGIFQFLMERILMSPYASLADRSAIPESLQSGLQGLRPRREKLESSRLQESTGEQWSSTERKIREVLVQLSDLPEAGVSRNTTIFQLGLDSISAVQIASLLRRKGVAVSALDVMECPSCAKLADRIQYSLPHSIDATPDCYDFEQFLRAVRPQVIGKISQQAAVEAILPCTPMQNGMMTSFVQSNGQSYLNTMTFTVKRTRDVEELGKALKVVQERHPMLRTAFLPIEHQHSSFAMARYDQKAGNPPMTIIADDTSKATSLEARVASIRKELLENSHLPPWHAVIEQKESLELTLVIHHALYDAQSLDDILRCLSDSMAGNRTFSLPPIEQGLGLVLQETLADDSQAKEFWESQAEGAVINGFPIMTPLRESEKKLRTWVSLSSLKHTDLQSATQRAGISIQAVIQAAWTRVLASYLGESSVVFGVSLAGRTHDETRNSPLPCLTTVPIVADNRASNRELLDHMMEINAKVQRFQFVPLSRVQKWLGHPATPVFDTLVSFRKPRHDDAGQLELQLVRDDPVVEFPVSIELEQMGDELKLSVAYRPDVLPTEQAKLLLRQFDLSMAHLATKPHETEDSLYASALDVFSSLPPRTPVMDSPVLLLHEFVELQADLQPDAPALEFVKSINVSRGEIERQCWTYRGLNEMGNRMAHMLSGKAPAGSIVAVHFEKCPEAYFSILGILKAGCSFVALDPGAPSARKEFILKDSSTPCVLTKDRRSLDMQTDAEIIEVGIEVLLDYPAMSLDRGAPIAPDATCYCLYTSGTTGTPKGCEITHENAVQAMTAFEELFRGHWAADSRWFQFASLHFDVSVLEQYWSWAVGITVVAAPKDLILDDLTGTINALDITHIDLTPSLARLTHPDEVPSLCRGVFITGGESLKQEILDVWGPKAVIYNAYGPTEATIGVTMYQRVPINGRPSNIGKQFPNVGSYVFKPNTEIPVLKGGVGELCVSGKLVGKGYLGRPELTEERFPTLSEFRERIYRTGDLVRLLHDGCFDFLGRADDQVKLRGQRLEIGEINHAIRTGVSEIGDVATIVTAHGSSGKDVLVTFFVLQADERPGTELLVLPDTSSAGSMAKEACRTRLPGYMVPTYCLRLPYIPLSANNKAEVKELKKLFASLSHEQLMELTGTAARSQPASVNRMASKVAKMLLSVFNIQEENISPEMSIFDLGVDSISVLRLSSFMKRHGIEGAAPAVILRHPVINDLALVLSSETRDSQPGLVEKARQEIQACSHRWRGLVCRVLSVKPHDIEYIASCSPLQQGIISRSMTSTEDGLYFNSFRLRLVHDVSSEKLHEAWDHLITKESVLRTRFVQTSDGYVQAALRNNGPQLKDISVKSNEEMSEFLQSNREGWLNDNRLQISEPLRLTLIEGPHGRDLLINIFHTLYDGNSFDLMLQRISNLIDGETPREAPSFVEALMHGPLWQFDQCRPFWEEHLRNWRPSLAPALSESKTEKPSSTTWSIPFAKLDGVRRSQNVTMQSVLLALWVTVLQPYYATGLTLGLIVSGRSIDLADVDKTIGPLFNTVPFFNDATNEQSWSSLIQKCHEFAVSILPFQHVPLQQVQKWVSKGRPLFDNLFTFQLEDSEKESSSKYWTIDEDMPNPDYPLAFEATCVKDSVVRITIAAQGHVADQQALKSLLQKLEENLEQMLGNVDQSLGISSASRSSITYESTAAVEAQTAQPHDTVTFSWSPTTLKIREEVAKIAGISETEVTGSSSMLELGLDSIDVIKLSAKLRSRGLDFSASQIMRLQTIANMGALDHESQRQESALSANVGSLEQIQRKLWKVVEGSDLPLHEIENVLPATALQESMVMGMIESNFEWYFNHDVLEIREGTDGERLRNAWAEVIDTLPILRTGFLEVTDIELEASYCQVVHKPQPPMIRDIRADDYSEVEAVIRDATEHAKQHHAQKNLLQLSFVTIQNRRLLVVSMAHALYDGWSLGLVYEQIYRAYGAHTPDRGFSDNVFERLLSSSQEDGAAFWSDYLHGATPSLVSEAPASGSKGPQEVHRLERSSPFSASEIMEFCRSQSISLQVLCQGCWAVALAHHLRQLDVTFGVVLSGRDFEGAEDLIFPTMNTVAARSILHGSGIGLLRYMEENMIEIRGFQQYPLRRAQMAVGNKPGGLLNTLFMLQATAKQAGDSLLFDSIDGTSAVDYPVCIEAENVGDALLWRIACHSQSYTMEDAVGFMDIILSVLSFFITKPSSDILSFTGSEVSICGLSAIMLKAAREQQQKNDPVAEEQEVEWSWSHAGVTIRDVLSQVSGLPSEEIQPSSNLYHLGLDSISAIKAASLLRRQNVNLGPRDLSRAANIAEMVAMAENTIPAPTPRSDEPDWHPPVDIDVDEILRCHGLDIKDTEAILPAIPMQVYMLATWQTAKGAVFYPEHSYFINSSCSRKDIDEAWRQVVETNPILRTALVVTKSNEIPVLQVILKTQHAGTGTNTRMQQPMVRFRADWDEDQSGWSLRIRIHHALYDGVSLPTILQQLGRLLSSHGRGDEGKRTAPDWGLQEWKMHAARPAEEAARIKRRRFWTEYLSGCQNATGLNKTVDIEGTVEEQDGEEMRKDYPIGRVSYVRRSAIPDVTRLRQNAARLGVSVQSVFLAAYARVLAAGKDQNSLTGKDQPSDSDKVVLGLYLANRSGGGGATTNATDPAAASGGSRSRDANGSSASDGPELPDHYPSLNLIPLKASVGRDCSGSVADVAAELHADILHVSSASQGRDVGLWEIEAWTGVTVSSFVNFLSLPYAETEEESEGVQIVPVGEIPQPLNREGLEEELSAPGEIPVKDSIAQAIDVEAAIHGNAMDIGVFGPRNMLPGPSDAEDLVSRIVDTLSEFHL